MSERPAGAPATFPVAELERRFYAFAVDRLITWGIVVAAAAATWYLLSDLGFWACAGIVLGVVLLVVLVTSAVLGATGSSPGKSLVGLRVVHHGTGTPIGFGRALLRSVLLGLAGLPTFGLGLATLAWTAVADGGHRRRGWHDHVAHSIVVDVRPAPPEPTTVDEAPRHVVNLTAMRLIPAPTAPPPDLAPAPARRPAEAGATSDRLPLTTQQPVPQPVQQPVQQPVPQPVPPWPPQQVPVPVPQPVPQPVPARPPQPAAHAAHAAPAAHAPPPEDGRTVVRGAHRRDAPALLAAAGPAPRWRVTFDNGDTFVVEGLALVGRRPEPRHGEDVRHVVPLTSADMSLSKTHAQFGPAPDGALVVMDRGSTNGSLLLRKGVTRELTAGKPATVVDGDTVRFGDREMQVSRER